MAQEIGITGCEGLKRWDEDIQNTALRATSGMCLRPEFIRASWLLGDKWSLDWDTGDAASSPSFGLDSPRTLGQAFSF